MQATRAEVIHLAILTQEAVRTVLAITAAQVIHDLLQPAVLAQLHEQAQQREVKAILAIQTKALIAEVQIIHRAVAAAAAIPLAVHQEAPVKVAIRQVALRAVQAVTQAAAHEVPVHQVAVAHQEAAVEEVHQEVAEADVDKPFNLITLKHI